jgi:hypothetical protein
VRVTDTVHVSPAVMLMSGTRLPPPPPPLLLNADVGERGAQSVVSAKGMCAGGGLEAGLTITAV